MIAPTAARHASSENRRDVSLKLTLEKYAQIAFGVAGLIIVLVGAVQYRVMHALVESGQWVDHSDRVVGEITATRESVTAGESAARGFALTGDPAFLEAVKESAATANRHERQIRSMTADNPRQQRRLDRLEPLLVSRFQAMDELDSKRSLLGAGAAAGFVLAGEGTSLDAAIESIDRELQNEEYSLLNGRRAALERSTARARTASTIASVVSLLLLASAGTLIRFELTRRRKLETSLRYEKDLFTTLMDTVPACICFKDMESRFLRINAALGRRLGVPDLAEAIGKSDTDYYAPEYAKKALSDEKQVLQTGRGVIDKEQQAVLKDGREMWVTYSKLPIVDHNGSIAGTYGISRDITLEKRADQALESANSTLANRNGELELRNRESTLLGEMGELLQGCVNEAEAETILSKFAPDLFPTLPGSLCTMKASRNLLERRVGWGDVTALAPLFTPDDCLALRTGQRYGSGDSNGRIRCPHIAGTFTGSFVCIPMMAHGETLGVLQLIRLSGKNLDKTELRLAAIVAEQMSLSIANLRLHEALKAQSIRDPLTGLFNRRYLEESMDREFHRADRAGSTIAAIMLDLDHFKRFNDTFGHDGGDAVLKEFSALLLTRTRKEDIVCRYGGEEFLIVLPGATLEDARIRAGELLEAIRKISVVSRGRELGPVSASMGVALYPEQGSTIGSLIRAADNALYRAKTRGRDCVVLAKTNSEAAGTEKPQVSDSKL